MGRTTEYFCDECKRKFGDEPHLNLKSGALFISYKKPGLNWKQEGIKTKCTEYHFCGITCLTNWIEKLFVAACKRVGLEYEGK